MTKRFRMIAGPNGSGKSTLAGLLRRDYAVNFSFRTASKFANALKMDFFPDLRERGAIAQRASDLDP